ncbi:UNVERIFIED_CONTAM: hypothetical protein Sradi_1544200 [Sesamum radiatum]|uniref:Reverse transcriptase domain-containing protein n=1 Tax=Sesamum radiatum TaxID=300843 RepID=A0AAW2U878_SESRA
MMAEAKEDIKGVAISRHGPRASHLLFADDTLVLCQATQAKLRGVKCFLEQLEATFGLTANLEKSSMALNKNSMIKEWSELTAVLEVQIVEKHGKYLSLPASVGRSKKAVFQYIKDQIWLKLQSWRYLTYRKRPVWISFSRLFNLCLHL